MVPTVVAVGSSSPPAPDAGAADAEPAGPSIAFVHAGATAPYPPGVVARADGPLLAAASGRARACLSRLSGVVRLRVKVVLGGDGSAVAELESAEGALDAAAARCVLDALAKPKYTKPGSVVDGLTTTPFFRVKLEKGTEPQEFQVD